MTSSDMRALAASLGRVVMQRTTLYRRAPAVETERLDPLQAESL
jgi:hypothetical protein